MKLNTNYIIGGVLVGGGLYYAYSKGWFRKKDKEETKAQAIENNQQVINDIKAEQKAVAVDKAKAIVKANAVKKATTIINPNSYAGKIAFIQSNLGVAVDGIAGKQTNLALEGVYGLYKGEISPSNIDYYVNRVKNKDTKAATLAAINAAKKLKATSVNVSNDAKKFLELVNNGKYQATLTKDVTANAFVFDKLKNSFVDIKEPKKFSKGSVFSYGQFRKIPRNGYVMYYNQGNPTSLKLYALNPNDFLVTI